MTFRQVDLGMIPAHLARINYAGDLGYELWVAPEYQRELFDRIVAAGEPHGLRLFGMRALMSLRLEKSYGTWFREYRPIYTPLEAGIARYIRLDHEFIGRAAHEAEPAAGGPKRRLVAFVVEPDPDDPADVIGDEPIWHDGAVVGWVTSGGYGHHVKQSIALGYVPTELASPDGPGGDGFEIEIIGRRRPARLQPEPLFDPQGRPDAPVTEAGRRRSATGGSSSTAGRSRSRRAIRSRSRSCGPARSPAGAARCASPATAATAWPRSTASPTCARARRRPARARRRPPPGRRAAAASGRRAARSLTTDATRPGHRGRAAAGRCRHRRRREAGRGRSRPRRSRPAGACCCWTPRGQGGRGHLPGPDRHRPHARRHAPCAGGRRSSSPPARPRSSPSARQRPRRLVTAGAAQASMRPAWVSARPWPSARPPSASLASVEGRLVRFEGTASRPRGGHRRRDRAETTTPCGHGRRRARPCPARLSGPDGRPGCPGPLVGAAAGEPRSRLPRRPAAVCRCMGVTVDDLDDAWKRLHGARAAQAATLAGLGTVPGRRLPAARPLCIAARTGDVPEPSRHAPPRARSRSPRRPPTCTSTPSGGRRSTTCIWRSARAWTASAAGGGHGTTATRSPSTGRCVKASRSATSARSASSSSPGPTWSSRSSGSTPATSPTSSPAARATRCC